MAQTRGKPQELAVLCRARQSNKLKTTRLVRPTEAALPPWNRGQATLCPSKSGSRVVYCSSMRQND